jgi:dUTPase
MIQFKKTSPFAVEPRKSDPNNIGYDLCSIYDGFCSFSFNVETGLSILLPEGFFGLIVPKDTINATISNGIVRPNVDKEISFTLTNSKYNMGFDIYKYQPVAELVIQEFCEADFFEVKKFL